MSPKVISQLPWQAGAVAETILGRNPTAQYPYLAEIAVEHVMKPGYSYTAEFEYGLDLLLHGLEQSREGA